MGRAFKAKQMLIQSWTELAQKKSLGLGCFKLAYLFCPCLCTRYRDKNIEYKMDWIKKYCFGGVATDTPMEMKYYTFLEFLVSGCKISTYETHVWMHMCTQSFDVHAFRCLDICVRSCL